MLFKVLDLGVDEVIKSHFITSKVDYEYAIINLIPLINRLDHQRNTLPAKYYSKLENDLTKGCIMPPLTIAIVTNDTSYVGKEEQYIQDNIQNAFVLDGIQRLNTLSRVQNKIDKDRILYLNVLICDSMDKLLYRMITLNNGQKPMSARHQIELLAQSIYNFDDLDLDIETVTEKEQGLKMKSKIKTKFKKADIVKAYLAFISNAINIDNQKIIESKLDELITDQIIDSNLPDREIEFNNVVKFINTMSEDSELYKWFNVPNNLIGFSAGIQKSHKVILIEKVNEFKMEVEKLEAAFSYLDFSKIKLGTARRRAVQYFVEEYTKVKDIGENELVNQLSQLKEI